MFSFKKLSLFKTKNTHCPLLEDLDSLYGNSISQLPIRSRRQYCQRLIERAKFDLCSAHCKERKKQLQQLITSATTEIFTLDGKEFS